MGQKILVPCFDVYNDHPFPEKCTVIDYIFNTKLEKGDHYYIQTQHRDLFFPLQSFAKKIFRKNVPKSA